MPWEPDAAVSQCPECGKQFGMILRKSHCRTCGKVVAGTSGCSDLYELSAIAQLIAVPLPRAGGAGLGQIRICESCKKTLERMASGKAPGQSGLAELYSRMTSEMKAVERQLEQYRGKFGPAESSSAPARAFRAEITKGFGSVQALAGRIAGLPECRTGAKRRMAAAIKQAAAAWQQPQSLMLKQMAL